jgi:hypothetical protein
LCFENKYLWGLGIGGLGVGQPPNPKTQNPNTKKKFKYFLNFLVYIKLIK